jgi:putative oxidoreductase
MKWKKGSLFTNRTGLFSITSQNMDTDIVLLLIRIACGYAFIITGWGKIQHPLNWMGQESSVPSIFQALAAIAEFCGGIALILGFLTRIAAFGIGCTMIVAIVVVRIIMGLPYVNMTGGNSYVLPVVYLLIMLLFLVVGPGRFSLDHLLVKERNEHLKTN